MDRITPHVEHGPDGTHLVAVHAHGEHRMPLRAGTPRVAFTRAVASDGSWAVEVYWPDVLAEQWTLPPAHGTWRREDGGWVPHDPTDPAQAARLTQTVADPPEVAARRLETRIAALEAAHKEGS